LRISQRDTSGSGAKIVNVIEHAGRWNHNIYYQDVLLHAVPANSRSALDVGCGEGTLTRELARRVPTVVGIDVDRPSIDEARRQVGAAGVEYLLGDFLSYPFEPESFDFIASVATLCTTWTRRRPSRGCGHY